MTEDPVYLGLTKPPMVWGVPYTYFALNVLLNVVVFIQTQKLLALFLGILVGHGIGYFICLRDQRFFDLALNRLMHFPFRSPNRKIWGGDSYAP